MTDYVYVERRQILLHYYDIIWIIIDLIGFLSMLKWTYLMANYFNDFEIFGF